MVVITNLAGSGTDIILSKEYINLGVYMILLAFIKKIMGLNIKELEKQESMDKLDLLKFYFQKMSNF